MKKTKNVHNKILQITAVVAASIVLFVGCESNMFNKAVDQGKLAIASKEYDKAKASFELALEEKQDDDVEKMMQQVSNMLAGLKAKENHEIDEAMQYFDKVINEDSTLSSMTEEAKQAKLELQQTQDKLTHYDQSIANAESMLEENKYPEIKEILNPIIEETKEQTEFLSQHKKAQNLLDKVHEKVAQIGAQKQEQAKELAEAEKNKKLEQEIIKQAEAKKEKQKKIYDLYEACSIAEKEMGLLGARRFEDDDITINGEVAYSIEIEFMAGDMPHLDQIRIGAETLNVYNYDGSFRMSLK